MKTIKRSKRGAAIVEFAIISTILIPITLYISFFSDLLHLRNKVDEMNYFAAWELPAYLLSDYDGEGANDDTTGAMGVAPNRMSTAINDIKTRTATLYKNYDSAEPSLENPFFMMLTPAPITFALAKSYSMNELTDGESGTTNPGNGGAMAKLYEVLNKGSNLLAGDLFRFNTEAVAVSFSVKADFTVTQRTIAANEGFGKDSKQFANRNMFLDDMINSGGNYTAKPFVVVADSWALNDGRDVRPNSNFYNYTYRKQVQRMFLLGLPNLLMDKIPFLKKMNNGLGKITSFLGGTPCPNSLTGFLGTLDPFCAHVASVNYSFSNGNVDDQASSVGANFGPMTKNVDGGQKRFQTTPLWYARSGDNFQQKGGDNAGDIPEYAKTLKKRRNNYMGNATKQCHYTGNIDSNGDMVCEN